MRYMVLLTAFVFIGIYSIYLLTFKNDSKTDTHVPFLPIEHLTFCRQREVEKEPETCSKVVLRDATRGHWVPKSLRENQKKEFLIAHNASQRYFGLRFPFDRLDGLCGNVTQFRKDFSSKWNIKNLFGHENKMLIFPAICNPKGSKPCCYNGRCTDLSEAECACPNCQDDRRTQHAEMAEWQTNDEKCLLKDVGQDATCGILLHKFDLVIFLGDSLIRQLYLALLLKLLGGPSQSILVDGTPEGNPFTLVQEPEIFSPRYFNTTQFQFFLLVLFPCFLYTFKFRKGKSVYFFIYFCFIQFLIKCT